MVSTDDEEVKDMATDDEEVEDTVDEIDETDIIMLLKRARQKTFQKSHASRSFIKDEEDFVDDSTAIDVDEKDIAKVVGKAWQDSAASIQESVLIRCYVGAYGGVQNQPFDEARRIFLGNARSATDDRRFVYFSPTLH